MNSCLIKIDAVKNSSTDFTINYANENGFYHSNDNGYNIILKANQTDKNARAMAMHEVNHAYQVVTGQINGDTTIDPNLMQGYDADKEFEAYRDQAILNNPWIYFLDEDQANNDIWNHINNNYDFGGTLYNDGSTTLSYSTTGH